MVQTHLATVTISGIPGIAKQRPGEGQLGSMMDDVDSDETHEDDVEFLDVGRQRTRPNIGEITHRWSRWPILLLIGLVAALVIVRLIHQHSKPSHPPTTHPIAVSELGHPVLGVTAGWELFGRGDGVVVRVQFARGRVTRTTVPGLLSGGPVSFVVGADEAVVRPIDYVPGYVVPDGMAARQIPARLPQGQGGAVFPGPDPNHIWVQSANAQPSTFALLAFDSSSPGVRISVPPDTSPLAARPDGAGYLLFPGPDGIYDARPDGLHRISSGTLLAVGSTGWLTLECVTDAHCVIVDIDRTTHAHRVIAPGLAGSGDQLGKIAPDGRTAALYETRPSSKITLHLLDLTTGVSHRLALPIDQVGYEEDTLAWSPDSHWLLVLAAGGGLDAVEASTGHVTNLSEVGIPPLDQLAVRNSPK